MASPGNRRLARIALLGQDGGADLDADLAAATMGIHPAARLRYAARRMGAGAAGRAGSRSSCPGPTGSSGWPGHRPAPARDRIASAPMSTSSPPSRRPGLPLRARLATTVGGAAGRASRLAGRGDGSVIGGVIGLRLKPDLLSLLARGRQTVLVTGTNGKTTTTRLITAAIGALGQQIASNAFGANMEAGLVSALARAPDATMAVLEVDEKYMPAMLTATGARVVVLLNLSRDQMDRAAEIWLLARRWRGRWPPPTAGSSRTRTTPSSRGPRARPGRPPGGRRPALARRLLGRPNCGSHLRRDGEDWHCGECPNRRPPVSWVLAGDEVIDPTGRSRRLERTCPGGPTGRTPWSRSPWRTSSPSASPRR